MATKKFKITIGLIINLFFEGCLFLGVFMILFISFSIVFAISPQFALTCFFNLIIPLLLKMRPNFSYTLFFN